MKLHDARLSPENQIKASPGQRKLRRSSALLSLEQRFMFDGAALATAVDAAHAAEAQAAETPEHPVTARIAEHNPERSEPRKEVVFIASNVSNHQALASGVREGVEVVMLDAGKDGLAQMAQWATTHSGYDAIHLISHGSEGRVELGSLSLDRQSANARAAELAKLGAALADGGDLLLYGCNVATGTGQEFIATLGRLSGADVAASNDLTGATRLGGDWQLERTTGTIEAQALLTVAAQEGYQALLANPTIDSATYDAHANILTVVGTGLNAGDLIDTSKLTVKGQGDRSYTLTSGIVTATSTGFSVVLNKADQAEVEALLNRNGKYAMNGYWHLVEGAANWNKTQSSAADTGNWVTVSNIHNYIFTFESDTDVEEDPLPPNSDMTTEPYKWLTQTMLNIDNLAGSEETLKITYPDGMVILGDTYEMYYGGSNYHIFNHNGLVLNNMGFFSTFSNVNAPATFSLTSGKEFGLLYFFVEDVYNQNGSFVTLTSSDGGFEYHPYKNDITMLEPSTDERFKEITSFSVKVNGSNIYTGDMIVTDNLHLSNVHTATATFSSAGTASTTENVSGTVYQAAATGMSTITYSLAGADAALFNINASTGAVSFKNSPDFETPLDAGGDNIYDFLVIASNDDGSTSKAVALTVSDVNDAPVITSPSTVSVTENTIGTIHTATATDQEGNTVSWSLAGDDAARFSIDPVSGALNFNTAPDYENPVDANGDNSYSIILKATDNGTGNAVGSQTLTIVVTNVNETPVITSAGSVSITENSTGTVYTGTGTDPDGGTLNWSLSGTDAALFNLDSSTGALSFKASPNYEAPGDGNGDNVYQVTLTATDSGVPPISVTRTLTITVTDSNDAPTLLSHTDLTGATEDTPFTIAYADLVTGAADEDGDPLSYVIDTVVSGTLTKNGVAVVAGSTLLAPGESLVWTPAANANGHLTAFTIRAHDGNLASTTAVDVRVQVAAVNDAPTNINLSSASIPEHSTTAAPLDVGTLSSTDPDSGNTFTYSIVGGADQAVFQISGSTLQLKAGTALDYETQSSYSVTVRSTDNTGLSFEKTLTIQLVDQNDAPAIGKNTGLTVNEGASITLGSAQLQITDVDTPAASLTLTLTDLPDHGTLFKSGVALTLGGSFTQADIDAGRISYTHDGSETTTDGFAFTVADGAGATLAATAFSISVTPVNEAPTVVTTPFAMGPLDRYLVSNKLFGVTTADVNNDGNLDLITGSESQGYSNPNAFSILLGNGDGTFTYHSSFGNDLNVRKVTTADLNNDGNADIIARDDTGRLAIYLGHGDGSFTPGPNPWVQAGVTHQIATDVNGDGKLDLVMADSVNNRVVVMTGNGDGSFNPLTGYACGGNVHALAVGDFNGDGHTDLVTANFNDNTASVLTGNGDGSFNPQVTYAVATGPMDVIVGDFNQDGILDFATSNRDGENVSVLIGNGNGTFGNRSDYSVAYLANSLATADMNGDGHLDLVVASSYEQSYSVLLGKGDGTFEPRIVFPLDNYPYARSTHLADVNNDGKPDVVMALLLNQSAGVILNTSQFASFTEHEGPVRINTGISLHDPDGDAGWNGSQLTVQISTHAAATDQLGLPGTNPGGNGIWLDSNGNKLMAGNLQIGTASAASASGGTAWTFTFNANATNALAQDVARAITFNNPSDDPGNASRSVTFTVTDAGGLSASASSSIAVHPINDAPTVQTNTGATLNEGTSITLGTGQLNIADVDSPAASRTLTLTDLPDHGTLFKSGVPLALGDSFTQADIDTGRITYTHDGSETTADGFSFSFSVSDGAGGTIASTAFALTINPVNDAPTLTQPGSFTLVEDTPQALTGISFSDAEAGSAPVTVILTVNAGSLAATGGAGVSAALNGATRLTLTGSLADINAFIAAGRVVYTPAPDATATATLTATVRDGGHSGSGGEKQASASTTLQITPVNDAPVLQTNTGATLNEGTSITLGTGQLSITDVDSPAASRTLTLTDLPDHGTLFKSGIPLALGDSFTQADLAAGRITYTHDGSETTADGFSFSVSDGAGGTIASTAFALTINPVNDAPTLTLPGSFTLVEDTPQALTGISFSDAEAGSAPVTVILTVNAGSLAATGGAGVSAALNGATSLTLTGSLADINAFIAAGRVVYTPAPDATATATLTATVRDGGLSGSGGEKQASASTILQITPVNDAPTIRNLDGDTASYLMGSGPLPIDRNLALEISDVDTPRFNGGTLTVSIVHNLIPGEDRLQVLHQGNGNGQIGISGSVISYSGTVIGSYSGGNGTDLVITFNSQASAQAVSALARQIAYQNADPVSATESTRTVRFVMTDGQGASSAPAEALISVSRNTPPTAGDASLTVLGNSHHVFSLNDFPFRDADAGDRLSHITLVALPSQGLLTLDGQPLQAGQQIAATDIAAGKLQFTPAANANGSASFSFTVSDGKSDSLQTYTGSITIQAVNDRPIPTDSAPGASLHPTHHHGNAHSDSHWTGSPSDLPFLSHHAEIQLGHPLAFSSSGFSHLLTQGQDAPFSELNPREQGFEIQDAPGPDREALVINQGMASQSVEGAGVTEIPVPADAFAHSSPDALIQLVARQANGRPLPDWVRFDEKDKKFIVRPPQGVIGELTIRLTARDAQGREASTEFSLRIGTLQDARDTTGRASLSEQIRQASRTAQSSWARSGTIA